MKIRLFCLVLISAFFAQPTYSQVLYSDSSGETSRNAGCPYTYVVKTDCLSSKKNEKMVAWLDYMNSKLERHCYRICSDFGNTPERVIFRYSTINGADLEDLSLVSRNRDSNFAKFCKSILISHFKFANLNCNYPEFGKKNDFRVEFRWVLKDKKVVSNKPTTQEKNCKYQI